MYVITFEIVKGTPEFVGLEYSAKGVSIYRSNLQSAKIFTTLEEANEFLNSDYLKEKSNGTEKIQHIDLEDVVL